MATAEAAAAADGVLRTPGSTPSSSRGSTGSEPYLADGALFQAAASPAAARWRVGGKLKTGDAPVGILSSPQIRAHENASAKAAKAHRAATRASGDSIGERLRALSRPQSSAGLPKGYHPTALPSPRAARAGSGVGGWSSGSIPRRHAGAPAAVVGALPLGDPARWGATAARAHTLTGRHASISAAEAVAQSAAGQAGAEAAGRRLASLSEKAGPGAIAGSAFPQAHPRAQQQIALPASSLHRQRGPRSSVIGSVGGAAEVAGEGRLLGATSSPYFLQTTPGSAPLARSPAVSMGTGSALSTAATPPLVASTVSSNHEAQLQLGSILQVRLMCARIGF
jgi:hypothetical protein